MQQTETGDQRSRIMRSVRRADTRPEMTLRRALHAEGYRYQLHRKDLPGTPDLVFPGSKKVIFVHGCFWHRHPGCANSTTPKTRREFWVEKFAANVSRDVRAQARLAKMGWDIMVVWECETGSKAIGALMGRVRTFLG